MLTDLRWLNVLIWTVLFFYMTPSIWAAVRRKHIRRGDPMRLSVAGVCVVIILGNLRWLFAPENQTLLAIVTGLAALVGLSKIVLAHTYGRGPKL